MDSAEIVKHVHGCDSQRACSRDQPAVLERLRVSSPSFSRLPEHRSLRRKTVTVPTWRLDNSGSCCLSCMSFRGVPELSVVSCRVAEGNGPEEATTTGSGFSLIKWCQVPPRLAGDMRFGEPLRLIPSIPDEAFVFLERAGPSAALRSCLHVRAHLFRSFRHHSVGPSSS